MICADNSTLEYPTFQLENGGSIPTSALHICRISASSAKPLLTSYHYLSKISKGYRSNFNFGLMRGTDLGGVCIFTNFPVPELSVGLFGLPREEHAGFFELSRLCLIPELQKETKNIASWFVARSIKLLRKATQVRAILSYADAQFHVGTVYKALGFRYYGLTQPKKDFYEQMPNGEFKKCSRGGSIKTRKGEWRYRTQKHRYLKVFDGSLSVKWEEVPYIK